MEKSDQLLGHVIRHNGLVMDILEAEARKKRSVSRPQLEYTLQNY